MKHNENFGAIKRIASIAFIMAASRSSWSQKPAGWQPAEVEPVKYNQTLAAASTAGHYSSGQQNGRAEFVVSCRQRRLFCVDCRDSGRRQVREYEFAWILPPVPEFNFELFTLGAGGTHDLATLTIGPNPPTPRHSGEVVLSDGRWKISLNSHEEDIVALRSNPGKKATLTLQELDASGIITIEIPIPREDSVLQAVLDACSDATFDFAGDRTTCPSRPGEELTKVKVCTLFPRECSEPELVGGGAVWHLDRASRVPSGREPSYRLTCEYKKSGSDDDTSGGMTDSGLSPKLTECDETLKPLSVSCR